MVNTNSNATKQIYTCNLLKQTLSPLTHTHTHARTHARTHTHTHTTTLYSTCSFTFDGPSLIFFIWFRYLVSSRSNFPIFLSMDSPRLSTPAMASVMLGGGAFFLPPPSSRFILTVCVCVCLCVPIFNIERGTA